MAFASTLSELGLGRWERLASVFGFNIGIETMQLVVVAATMPSLLMLSRTAAYSVLRICGALLAAIARLGWIAERLFKLHSSVDVIVNGVAHLAPYVAGGLFTVSLLCWLPRNGSKEKRAVGTLSQELVERV